MRRPFGTMSRLPKAETRHENAEEGAAFGRALAIVLALVAVAGCGGPRVPLEVGVKEFPSDVLIARAKVPAPVPVPVPRRLVGRLPRQLQTEPVALPRLPARELCPAADPLAAPAVEAPNSALKPPVEGTYLFRNDGTAQVGALKGPVPPVSTRTVKNVKTGNGTFTFDVEDTLTAITTSYLADATGLYITKQIQKRPEGPATFEPTPDLLAAQFPLENGDEWTSAGSDMNTRWVFNGLVGAQRDENHDGKPDDADGDRQPDPAVPKMRVDACGAWIDAWAVRIIGPHTKQTAQGQTVETEEGPSKFMSGSTNLDIKVTAGYATQFGGLIVEERVQWDGTAAGQPVHIKYVTTIAQVPAAPK